MTYKPVFNALIIGAGNIGAFFDVPGSANILTHAHAYNEQVGFKLLGFIDINMGNAKKGVSLWGGDVFTCLDEVFEKNNVDVISVATPDHHHYEILKEISEFPIKCVFAEKPLTKRLEDAAEIIHIYKEKKIDLFVNFSRRFVPEFEVVNDNIKNGLYGEYLGGSGLYGKGINHSGSHLIDLLRYFIGEIKASQVTDCLFDFYCDDPSVSGILTIDNGKKFYLQHLDCNLYSVFEMDIFFEKKRIRIKDLGFFIEEYNVIESDIFAGYRNIVKTRENQTSLGKAMYYAVNNIYNSLTDKGTIIKCSGIDGYKAVEVCTDIVKKTRT